MPQVDATVHEGFSQPITFTIKNSAGSAIDLSTGNYPRIALVVVHGTRSIIYNTTDGSPKLVLSTQSGGTLGQIVFTPDGSASTTNRTFQAGDNGIHRLNFRLFTSTTSGSERGFGVPDGKYIYFRVLESSTAL